MKRILAIALLLASFPASAFLTCADGDQHATWSVGQPYPFDNVPSFGDPWCEASGAELTYIRQHFSGIRGRSGQNIQGDPVVFWEGDDASFIMDNL